MDAEHAEQRAGAGTGAGSSSESAAQEMRITQGGNIRVWVKSALKFFEARKSHSIYQVPN
jgi:hypothetical protein